MLSPDFKLFEIFWIFVELGSLTKMYEICGVFYPSVVQGISPNKYLTKIYRMTIKGTFYTSAKIVSSVLKIFCFRVGIKVQKLISE